MLLKRLLGKALIIVVVISMSINAQDVKLRIPTSSINNLFDSFIKARMVPNFNKPTGTVQYSFTPTSFILIVPQPGTNTFQLILETGGNVKYVNGYFNFTYLCKTEIKLVGQLSLLSVGMGTKILFVPDSLQTHIKVFSAQTNPIVYVIEQEYLDNYVNPVIDNEVPSIISQLPELSTTSQLSLIPSVASEYFTSTTPTLSTTANEIILGLTVKNTNRYVTAYNDVNQNQKVGNIDEVINGTVASTESSPRIFSWNANTTHQIQTPQPILTEPNGKNKYRNWFNAKNSTTPEQEVYSRRINVPFIGTEDLTYYAKFDPAQRVQLTNLLEGSCSGGTVSYESTTAATFDDYDYQHPTQTHPINTTVPNGTLGVNWIWQGWSDGNMSQSRNIIVNADKNLTANYKGSFITNNTSALANSSQRKIVRTDENGYLYLVYESMNRIWLERSVNGGISWTLCNNGQPIDNGPEAKSPSIDYVRPSWHDYTNNELFITYQQKTANGNYTIEIAHCNTAGTKLSTQTIYTSPSSYTNNATPALSSTLYYRNGYRKQIVGLWKEPASAGVNAGLYWYGAYYGGTTFTWNDPVTKYYQIANTNSGSANPTIDVFKFDGAAFDGGQIYFHYAWEQNGTEIKYQKIICGYSGVTISGPTPAATLKWTFSYNYRPSITVISNTEARICWKGNLDIPEPEEDISCALFANPANPNQYWCFGNGYVTTANISKWYETLFGVAGYAIGFTQQYGTYSSYAVKNTSLSSPVNLNTSGRDMQLYNGNDFSTMRGITLAASSAPYTFQLSNAIETGGGGGGKELEKSASLQISTGRTGVVLANGADFYFTIGDVVVDGEKVSFPEMFDTTTISNDFHVRKNLISQPFLLTTNSIFTYGVQYGVTDSAAAANAVANNFVRFKVVLLDAATEEIIGIFDDVKYSSSNIEKYNNIGYEVNTEGIGNRKVQLQLAIVTNLNPKYLLGDIIVPAGSALAKKAASKKQISYKGSLVVTEYALEQNFPNPFNPTTTIKYQIPNDGYVTMKVFDNLGREVAILVNEYKTNGRYEVTFDGSKLSSGIYYYSLKSRPKDGGQSGKYQAVKKFVLLK